MTSGISAKGVWKATGLCTLRSIQIIAKRPAPTSTAATSNTDNPDVALLQPSHDNTKDEVHGGQRHRQDADHTEDNHNLSERRWIDGLPVGIVVDALRDRERLRDYRRKHR